MKNFGALSQGNVFALSVALSGFTNDVILASELKMLVKSLANSV